MKHITTLILAGALWLGAVPCGAQDAGDERAEEREAYQAARRDGSAEAWEIFMNNYPNSYYYEQARKMRDAAVVNDYCNERTTLDRLVAYIDNGEAHEPRIRTFYANLVNNPTHSYRMEHMNVGFGGCTGTVRETIVMAGEKAPRNNVFEFNAQGLLTRSSIVGSSGKAVVTTCTYAYDNLHGYSLKQRKSGGRTVRYAPFYDKNDRLNMFSTDAKQRITYTYTETGALSRMVISTPELTRTLTYNGGYVTREDRSDGTATRFLYDYDPATGKKFPVGIKEYKGSEVVHDYKMEYRVDTHGRVTSLTVTLDGKPHMTLTRSYE